jgi:hypothetical protein
VTNKLVL